MRLSILLFVLVSTTAYSQILEIEPMPDWVIQEFDPVTSTVSKYDINSGFYTTIYDNQINLETEADFMKIGSKILTVAGVRNASEIYISIDTSYQKLVFHELKIKRDGEELDRTKDLSFEFLKNEYNLSSNIYTGRVTVHDILEDVRKGDEIIYAYTIIGDNPIYDGLRYRFVPMTSLNPIDFLRFRVNHKDADLNTKCQGCGDKLKLTQNDSSEDRWTQIIGKNIPAGYFEDSSPPWDISYDYFVLSNGKNWDEIRKWGRKVFDLDTPFDLSEMVEKIVDSSGSQVNQIDQIIDFVQDEIRYMGIESGIGRRRKY